VYVCVCGISVIVGSLITYAVHECFPFLIPLPLALAVVISKVNNSSTNAWGIAIIISSGGSRRGQARRKLNQLTSI
jgi:hypothetical protein